GVRIAALWTRDARGTSDARSRAFVAGNRPLPRPSTWRSKDLAQQGWRHTRQRAMAPLARRRLHDLSGRGGISKPQNRYIGRDDLWDGLLVVSTALAARRR